MLDRRSASRYRPPSEKLSGVTFTMPISSGRLPSASVRVRSRQDVARGEVAKSNEHNMAGNAVTPAAVLVSNHLPEVAIFALGCAFS